MSNDKNQRNDSLVPSGKREIAEYSSALISRGLDLVKIVDQEQKIGLFPVKIQGIYGYINKVGDIVIKPKFNHAFWFEEGLAVVEIACKWGYIDNGGNGY